MKKTGLFIVLMFLIIGCNDDETVNNYNFAVLGIEKVLVDDFVIATDSLGFPSLESDSITIVGLSNTNSTISYELVVYDPQTKERAISVKSKYDDVKAQVDYNSESGWYGTTLK